MKIKFNTIAICSSKKNKQITSIADQCCEVLDSLNVKVLLNENLVEVKNRSNCKKANNQNLKKVDLMIVIGGDGSILGFARQYGSMGIPLLGINLGNLGFLADIAPENLTSCLREIIHGKFVRDKRFFLEAQLNNKKTTNMALNEIVIHSGAIAKLLEFELFINKKFVYRQRADGLIINSPTGSTAYSLSGGGPIVHPDVNAITLLPMFPHSISTSPLLVKDSSQIEIRIVGNKNKSILSMDSHDSLTLKIGDIISIRKSKSQLTLIHPKDHDFFSACRNKLGWSSSIALSKDS